MTDWKPVKMIVADPFPHLTESERTADIRTLQRKLEQARRDSSVFSATIADIIKRLMMQVFSIVNCRHLNASKRPSN